MLQAIIAYGLHRKIEIVVKVCRCREGTAKFAETAGEKDHHLQKVLQKHVENSRAIRWHSENYMKKENIQIHKLFAVMGQSPTLAPSWLTWPWLTRPFLMSSTTAWSTLIRGERSSKSWHRYKTLLVTREANTDEESKIGKELLSGRHIRKVVDVGRGKRKEGRESAWHQSCATWNVPFLKFGHKTIHSECIKSLNHDQKYWNSMMSKM